MEYDSATCSALVIGTGCMPNCNFALINAKEGKVRDSSVRILYDMLHCTNCSAISNHIHPFVIVA